MPYVGVGGDDCGRERELGRVALEWAERMPGEFTKSESDGSETDRGRTGAEVMLDACEALDLGAFDVEGRGFLGCLMGAVGVLELGFEAEAGLEVAGTTAG